MNWKHFIKKWSTCLLTLNNFISINIYFKFKCWTYRNDTHFKLKFWTYGNVIYLEFKFRFYIFDLNKQLHISKSNSFAQKVLHKLLKNCAILYLIYKFTTFALIYRFFNTQLIMKSRKTHISSIQFEHFSFIVIEISGETRAMC